MVTCEHCGKQFNPSDGAWDDGDYMCGECIAGYVERTNQDQPPDSRKKATPSAPGKPPKK
jgi:hypothetical protein